MNWNFIAEMHPLMFLGLYVLITTLLYCLVTFIITKCRPAATTHLIDTQADPYLLAWINKQETGVIQLAMFQLLHKKYLQVYQSPEGETTKDYQLLSNPLHAESNMNKIEKILFDHFITPKPCHENLPYDLTFMKHNNWYEKAQNCGVALTPEHRSYNTMLIIIISAVLCTLLAYKSLLINDTFINSSIFSWLLMSVGGFLYWALLFTSTLKSTRLDRDGISLNAANMLMDIAQHSLPSDANEMNESEATLYMALNGIRSFPDSYQIYKDIIEPMDYPFILQRLD